MLRSSTPAILRWLVLVLEKMTSYGTRRIELHTGVSKLGYIEKDLRNALDTQQREELNSRDAHCILSYLDGRSRGDLGFYYKSLWESEDRSCKVMDKLGNENKVEKEPSFDTLDPKVVETKGHNSHKVNNKRKHRQSNVVGVFLLG
ncbi:hypothetical protein M9H77_02717 [Catharanthus roseus]|uniref:Uncharacterized protein n=1 Tax=Catharanthus roseus TaxID=4058 RepID=A0ACC0C9B9_CATRO|nr:hypothetical protein M9H77_02717 [Catharanthus roseus]